MSINLKVGQTWRTRGGRMVTVQAKSSERSFLVDYADDTEAAGYLVGADGETRREDRSYGLVERVTRVYIAGPMTDIPEFNFPAFHAAAAEYRKRGCFVLNPAEINPEQPDVTGWTKEQYDEFWCDCMRRDIPALLTCEMIVLLPGWENSKGANLELHNAKALGMAIVYPEEVGSIPEGARRIPCCCQPGESCYQDKNGRIACDDEVNK